MRAFAIDRIEADSVDPFVHRALRHDPVLRDAFEQRVFVKCRIAKPRILRVRGHVGCAEQNPYRLLPQTCCVFEADCRLQKALPNDSHAGLHDVVHAEANDRIQRKCVVRRRVGRRRRGHSGFRHRDPRKYSVSMIASRDYSGRIVCCL